MGAFPLASVGDEPADAVLFGAPHGTPYPGIDNRVHQHAPRAVRAAALDGAEWVDHWNYDVGGPVLGRGGSASATSGTFPLARSRRRRTDA